MEYFGYIACVLITLAYIPQCIKIYKTNNINGLSLKTFSLIWIGMLFWIIHAILISDLSLLVSSIGSFIQNSYILYKIIKS